MCCWGADASLAPLERLLVERTEGNPFFLEESVRTLAESGALVGERGAYRLGTPIETVRVPPTVQAVLAARIDRLAPEDKRLLQCAAVIGETVPVDLLRAVSDLRDDELRDGPARLRAAEFLQDISVLPVSQYVFRHGLTCRVAYNSLLQDRRRALHGRIVEAIERVYPDRLGEHVERLAHHARQGELWARAADYLRQAGVKAFARSANREAVAWFEQALPVVDRLPDDPATQTRAVDLHLDLRNALTLLGRARADPRSSPPGAGAGRPPRRSGSARPGAVVRGQLPVPPGPARASHRVRWPGARGSGGPRRRAAPHGDGHVRRPGAPVPRRDRLEQIRMQRATWVEGKFDYAGADREYARAFRDYGVDVEELAVETSIDRLKARPALAIPLAAALDDWVFARRAGFRKGCRRLEAAGGRRARHRS